jgi:uncharacterized membrane protein
MPRLSRISKKITPPWSRRRFVQPKISTVWLICSIYVPTTPNPTSGFFIMLPKKEVIELDMHVDEAFKLIISTGVVTPEQH